VKIQLDDKMKNIDSISSEKDQMLKFIREWLAIPITTIQDFWSSNDYKEIFTELYDFNARKNTN
jgi:hypothetical protein